jgi:hypothetical protein
LLFTRHDESIILLEVNFVGRVNKARLSLSDSKVDGVVGFELGVQKLSEVGDF